MGIKTIKVYIDPESVSDTCKICKQSQNEFKVIKFKEPNFRGTLGNWFELCSIRMCSECYNKLRDKMLETME